MHVVQVYEISRHYGGPEEGGWWYDWLSVIFTKRLKKRRALKLAKILLAELPDERYDRHSVLGRADTYVTVRKKALLSDRGRRPRYE